MILSARVPTPTPQGVRGFGAKIYPTGDAVLYPVPKRKPTPDPITESVKELWHEESEIFLETARLFGLQAARAELLAQSTSNANMQAGYVRGASAPIESTIPLISHTPRNRRGSKGLGTNAARVLRFSAGAIERNAGTPTALSFLTLTLPPMSEGAWIRVLKGWPDIVRTFNQWLKRRLTNKGLPGDICGCVELQTKRAARTGEPALHTHLVFQGRLRRGAWAVTPRQCRDAWRRSVETFAQESLEFSNCENLVQVRKSASRYLAKYLSKGGNQWKKLVGQAYQDLHPSAWSITPDRLKKAFVESTWSGDEAVAVATLAINDPKYRYGSYLSLPIYRLPNGQWVKVVVLKIERSFAASLDDRWIV